MLDVIKDAPRDQTLYGVAVWLSAVTKAEGWALNQPDPMDGEPRRKVSQVCM